MSHIHICLIGPNPIVRRCVFVLVAQATHKTNSQSYCVVVLLWLPGDRPIIVSCIASCNGVGGIWNEKTCVNVLCLFATNYVTHSYQTLTCVSCQELASIVTLAE
mgnify:FL=1